MKQLVTNLNTLVYLTISLILIALAPLKAQKAIYLNAREIFIIDVAFDSVLLTDKCPCSNNKKELCSLFKIDILNIDYMGDSSRFSKDELIKVKYLLMKTNTSIDIKKNNKISVGLGKSKKYLIYKRNINSDSNSYFPADGGFYLTPEPCLDLNIFERMLVLTKIKKITFYINRNNKNDPFLNLINQQD